jgi:hypothetical protein
MHSFYMVIIGMKTYKVTDFFSFNIIIVRNATIQNNEFVWIGDSAMAAWGTTIDNHIKFGGEQEELARGGERTSVFYFDTSHS